MQAANILRLVISAGAIALAASAANAQIATTADVDELAARWTQAYNRHDRAALEALYTDDARLMMHGAPTIAGRDAIGDFWARDFTESNPITVLNVTHGLEGIDMVLVHGNYEVIDRDLWFERSEPVR